MKIKKYTIMLISSCLLLFIFSASVQATGLNDKVTSKSASIKLDKSNVSLYKNGSLKLKATVTGSSKKITWNSTNPKIATVNVKGKVTAKRAGTTTITAKANGKIAKCKITVKNPSIKLNKKSAVIYISGIKTVQLKAVVKGKSSKVAWKSSNKKIATVNSKGKVIAKKAGTVTITAKANGKTVKCVVTVKDALSDMIRDLPNGSWWSSGLSGFKYSLSFSKHQVILRNVYGRFVKKYKIDYVEKTSYGYFIKISGYYNYRWYKSRPYCLDCYSSSNGDDGHLPAENFNLFGC